VRDTRRDTTQKGPVVHKVASHKSMDLPLCRLFCGSAPCARHPNATPIGQAGRPQGGLLQKA